MQEPFEMCPFLPSLNEFPSSQSRAKNSHYHMHTVCSDHETLLKIAALKCYNPEKQSNLLNQLNL